MQREAETRSWPVFLLAATLLGCPTGDDDAGDDDVADDDSGDDDSESPYEITEPDGWAEIPEHGLLALAQLVQWFDFTHPLVEPVPAGGGCTVVREAHDPWDGPATALRTTTFSPQGWTASEVNDSDADGTPERWTECTFDGDGLRTRCDESPDDWATIGETRLWEYDGEGRMTREELQYNGSGEPARYYTWSYDGDGHLVERLSWFYVDEEERWGTRTATYTWSPEGRVTHVHEVQESETDGITGVWRIYLHGEDGVPTRYDVDEGDDGILDLVSGYTFDGADKLVEDWCDHDADGTVDIRYTFSDFDGVHPRHADVEEEAGASTGTIELAWDGADHVVDFQVDHVLDFGGATMHQVTEYDGDGNLTYLCQDDDLGSCSEMEEWFTYEDGRLVLEEQQHSDLEHIFYSWTCP